MTVASPAIYDVSIDDVEAGVRLRFSLDEGLEPSEELWLWVRARIRKSNYFQPLDLNILPGGKTADTIIEPGKVQVDNEGRTSVEVEWYMEKYPEREKSEPVKKSVPFTPDWFGLPMFEHELRSLFERVTVEAQAVEAARYRMLSAELVEKEGYRVAALNSELGLWVVMDSANNDTIGISPDQLTEGYEWRKDWFAAVLARRQEILDEAEAAG